MTRVSLVTAVYDPPLEALEDTIASVLAQTWSDWEWILVDDRSPDEAVRVRLERLAVQEPRVTVIERASNGGIVAASNDAVQCARGEWIALLDHDDVLVPHALATALAAIDEADSPAAAVDYCYSDQDRMSADGRLHAAYRKPDWSPERLRHHMYTTHFSLLRRAQVLEVGGFRLGYDGSQDHDLVLRVTERARGVVHVPEVLYHWREVAGSSAADSEAKPWAWDAGVRAVQDHLDRVGVPATAAKGASPGHYLVRREPDLDSPVSIVIPTRGSSSVVWGSERLLVRECVRTVRARSRHRALEFVVVYDTATPPAVLDELRLLGQDVDDLRLQLVEYDKPFNFSEKCNLGALHAAHDTLLFLNDDMEAASDGLVEQLIAPLREPGVGMTGARLLFETTRVQHGGVSFGSGTVAPMYHGASGSATGLHGELQMNREVTALTGACVAMRRDTFLEVGGFSEAFPMNYNDVDLSLKVARLGLRRLWLHECVLFHFESLTRSPEVHEDEKDRIQRRWGNYRVVRERYSNGPR